MPQPIRKWYSDITFAANAAAKRPKLAALIVQVSSQWANAQVQLGVVLAATLKDEAQTGMQMYFALSGSAAQEATIMAAVNHRLPAVLQDEFRSLFKEYKSRSKERNRVVHCMWGITSSFQNGLLNCSPDQMLKSVFKHGHKAGEPVHADHMKEVLVYTEKDLFDLCDAIQALTIKLMAFSYSVARFNGDPDVDQGIAEALAAMERKSPEDSHPPGLQT